MPPGKADPEFRAAVRALMTEPRQVTATARFRGAPGRADDAARAWAFELTYYFLRGVSEEPHVMYAGGIYTVTGLMQTTHPGDKTVTDFTRDEPWSLDFCLDPGRQERLRATYPSRDLRYDGRGHEAAGQEAAAP